jgi:hypothetical protein
MLDLDLTLAILHHFAVFALFGVLFAEFVLVRRGMDAAGAARVVAIDAWYGVLAALTSSSASPARSSPQKAGTITPTTRSSGPKSGRSWLSGFSRFVRRWRS